MSTTINNIKDTLVVNLFAGPGSGKSTGAAYIFAKLKMRGINAELVTEYAKDLVWADNLSTLANQIHVYGEQSGRISRVAGKVQVIITDSPLLMSSCYCKETTPYHDAFCQLVKQDFEQYTNINYFLKRIKAYNPAGRLQDETAAKEKDSEIKAHLIANNTLYEEVKGFVDGYDKIVEDISKLLAE